MNSALYLQVSIISQALIFVTRSRSWSFVECPGFLLVIAFLAAQLVRTTLFLLPPFKPFSFEPFSILCYVSSPPLVDIVFFGFSLKVFKTRSSKGGFHILIMGVSFSSPTDVEFHNPPPFRAQHPCLAHCLMSTPFGTQPPRQCLALIPFVTIQVHRLHILSSLDFHPQGF